MIKIGIVGCGWIVEKAYMEAFKSIETVYIDCIYDINIERLCYIKKKFNFLHLYTDYEEFLSSDIDAVVIASPNYTHSYYTNLALKSGKHVLCEKPVALSVEEYKESIKIANKMNKILLPAFVNRFRSDVDKLRNLSDDEKLGKLHSIQAKWKRVNGIPRPGSWITHKIYSGGGVLADLGPHIFDICFMLMEGNKKIGSVFLSDFEKNINFKPAIWCQREYKEEYAVDVEINAEGAIELDDNLKLQFELSWDSDIEGDTTNFEFIFEKGKIILDTLFGFGVNRQKREATIIRNYDSITECYKIPIGPEEAQKAFNRQAKYFIGMIQGRKSNYLTSSDGLYVTDGIEKLYASILNYKE